MDGLCSAPVTVISFMSDYIPISMLNDFIFCPYSIYLHNVYMDTDESLYHAVPQVRGRIAHRTIDHKTASTRRTVLMSLSVCSEALGLMGKIDLYRLSTKTLIERKYQLKKIFRGQVYQLWAEYYCMLEMGFDVLNLAFYETSTNKFFKVDIPDEKDKKELELLIDRFRTFNPEDHMEVNFNKCRHCIYSNLCDKTDTENVYT